MSSVLQHTYTGTELFPVVTSPDPAAKASMDTGLPSAGSKVGSSGDKNAAIEPEAIEWTSKARGLATIKEQAARLAALP